MACTDVLFKDEQRLCLDDLVQGISEILFIGEIKMPFPTGIHTGATRSVAEIRSIFPNKGPASAAAKKSGVFGPYQVHLTRSGRGAGSPGAKTGVPHGDAQLLIAKIEAPERLKRAADSCREQTKTCKSDPSPENCEKMEKMAKDLIKQLKEAAACGFSPRGLDLSHIDFSARNDRNFSDFSDFSDFSGMDLQGVNFDRSDVSGAVFDDADLSGATFKDVIAVSTYFQNSRMVETVMDGGNFTHSDFSSANMERAYARQAVFDESNLSHVRAPYADFTKASAGSAATQDMQVSGAKLGKTFNLELYKAAHPEEAGSREKQEALDQKMEAVRIDKRNPWRERRNAAKQKQAPMQAEEMSLFKNWIRAL